MPVAGAADLTLTVSNNLLYENGDSTATGAKPVMFQRAQDTDIKATRINGNSAGQLNSFTIAANGEVVGVFTNGEKLTLSTIQIADFDNPPGLMKMGANMFAETNNSGVPKFGQPGQGSFGALAPGALEMSNVDLSQEFTDMITTQRGFQANSKIITTTDEMLQELVNLKR
jgi:flagellar hook protein FlgE